VHPEDWPKLQQSFAEHTVSRAESWVFPYRILRADGSVRWVQQRAKIYYSPAGNVTRVVGTHLDVTEQRNSEEVIRQKQKLESIGLLAGGIAHDFNNLLVGMLGGASYLRELVPPDHPGASVVDLIEKSSEQAAHLTRQLLAYAG